MPITQHDVDATGEVVDYVIYPGASLLVAKLIKLMLVRINDTATAKTLSLIGGPRRL